MSKSNEGPGKSEATLKKPFTDTGLKSFIAQIERDAAKGLAVRKLIGDGRYWLYLEVTANAVMSWTFRYRINGRPRTMGIGPLAKVTLAQARDKAKSLFDLVNQGIDPLEEKAQEKVAKIQGVQANKVAKGLTLADLLEEHIEKKRRGHRDARKWEDQVRQLARDYLAPIFRDTPADKWTYDMALAVFERDMEKGGEEGKFWHIMYPTAKRVKELLILLYERAALKPGYSGGDPLGWIRRFKQDLLTKKELDFESDHHPALPYNMMADFLAELRSYDTTASLYLEFLSLTVGPRAGPTLAATWDQMRYDDTEDAEVGPIWIVPLKTYYDEDGKRVPGMKACKKPFEVPLVPRAVEILRIMADRRQNKYVFPGAAKHSHLSGSTAHDLIDAMCLADKNAGIPPRWVDPKMDYRRMTQHGMRATFTTHFEELDPCPFEFKAIESAIGHTNGNDPHGGAYRRSEWLAKRRKILEHWAAYIEPTKIVPPRPVSAWAKLTADDLRRLVWSRSTRQLASEFDVSDVAIGKRCKTLGIIKPPKGYWSKVQAGLLPHPKGKPQYGVVE